MVEMLPLFSPIHAQAPDLEKKMLRGLLDELEVVPLFARTGFDTRYAVDSSP